MNFPAARHVDADPTVVIGARVRLSPDPRRLLDDFRDSLFWLPLLSIAGALVAAWLTIQLGSAAATDDVWWLVSVTSVDRQALLTAVATSAATVLGLGTSALVITVQLASSQYSPRVVRTFIRERIVRSAIGALLGLFAYALTTLALPPDGAAGQGSREDVAATVALLGGFVALVLLVAMIDRIAHAMEAGSVIRRVLREFRDALGRQLLDGHVGLEPSDDDTPPDTAPHVVTAPEDAWLVSIDRSRLLAAAPPGSTVHLGVAPGRFCISDYPLLRVWLPDGDELDDACREALLDALHFGSSRDARTDVAFGLRKFNDVILRALSPAVNDPGTAYEAMSSLAAAVCALLRTDLPPAASTDDDDRRLLEPFARDHREYVHLAYEQVRHVAADHPAMAVAMLNSLRRIRTVLEHEGRTDHLDLLDDQRDALVELVEHRGHAPTDLDRIREAAALADETDDGEATDADEQHTDAQQGS